MRREDVHGAVVVGVEDTALGRAAVTDAAFRALRRGAIVHVVATYERADTGAERPAHPSDAEHRSRGEAEGLARAAAVHVAALGVEVREYVVGGPRPAALRELDRLLDTPAAGARTPRDLGRSGGRPLLRLPAWRLGRLQADESAARP